MNQIIITYLENETSDLTIYARQYYEYYNYNNKEEPYRRKLQCILQERSSFKRALKEYKEQCEFIQKLKYKETIEKYRNHPDKFIEEMCGVKLYSYQKAMFKIMTDKALKT